MKWLYLKVEQLSNKYGVGVLLWYSKPIRTTLTGDIVAAFNSAVEFGLVSHLLAWILCNSRSSRLGSACPLLDVTASSMTAASMPTRWIACIDGIWCIPDGVYGLARFRTIYSKES